MIQDGKEMTEFLLGYMDKERITLLGHSWGSLYGANLALKYPEYYEAFIGAGQFIDPMENEKRLYEAAQKWSNGDEEGKAILAKWSPDNEYSMEALNARNGVEFYSKDDYLCSPIISRTSSTQRRKRLS